MDKDKQIEELKVLIELQNEVIESLNELTSALWRIIKGITTTTTNNTNYLYLLPNYPPTTLAITTNLSTN